MLLSQSRKICAAIYRSKLFFSLVGDDQKRGITVLHSVIKMWFTLSRKSIRQAWSTYSSMSWSNSHITHITYKYNAHRNVIPTRKIPTLWVVCAPKKCEITHEMCTIYPKLYYTVKQTSFFSCSRAWSWNKIQTKL